MMSYKMPTSEIKGLMRRRGVTIEDLAEEMGIEKARVDQVLNGYTYLSDDNAMKIMDALEEIKKQRARVPKKTYK